MFTSLKCILGFKQTKSSFQQCPVRGIHIHHNLLSFGHLHILLPINSFEWTDYCKSDSRIFLHLHLPLSLSFKPLRLGQDVDVAVLRYKIGHQNISPKIYTRLSRNKIWHQSAKFILSICTFARGLRTFK